LLSSFCWELCLESEGPAAAWAQCPPEGEQIIEEHFDDSTLSGIVLPWGPGTACGVPSPAGVNAACVDDLSQSNGGIGSGRLLLTQAFEDQVGAIWIEQPFDFRAEEVSVSFDLFLFGGSSPPADGLSIVFVLGAQPPSLGQSGGSLGTGGLSRESLSVAIDVWDNGENDPETPCDGVSARTCHLEVNRNTDPGREPSWLATSDVPNILGAGRADVPVRITVTLNERELIVTLATTFEAYGEREVIRTLLDAPLASDGDGIGLVGITAATGNATLNHAIDDLCVWRAPAAPPVLVVEPPLERGGSNCGGGPLNVSWQGESFDLLGECYYDDVVRVEPGTVTRFFQSRHGRLRTGDDNAAAHHDPIDNLPDPTLEPLLQTEAWSRTEVAYRHDVVPGRYRIVLFAAESCTCGVDRSGAATRRYDVLVGGEAALLFFSPAADAGARLGLCRPALSAATWRQVEVDIEAVEPGRGLLEIRVLDLGGGDSPGDAQLNGFLYERLGEVTGEPIAGDIESNRLRPPSTFIAAEEVISLSFDGAVEGALASEALAGIATVGFAGPGPIFLQFQPILSGGRLRLLDDSRFASAASAVFDLGGALLLDPLATRLDVSVDIFASSPDGRPPADGLVIGLTEGSETRRLGGPGGSLGFAGIGVPGIGVEVDLWEGGGFGDDSGFNTDGQCHVAIVGSGSSGATVDHVQDQNDFDPSLDGPGWIDCLSPAGFRLEATFFPEGRVESFLTALDGSFPRRRVLDSFVTPFRAREARFGIFAASGGETATIEVDNVRVTAQRCAASSETARIVGPEVQTIGLDQGRAAAVTLDGSPSTPGSGAPEGEGTVLDYRWRVSGPFAGAEIHGACTPTATISFSEPGRYEVSLEVDDRYCGRDASAFDAVTVIVRATSGALLRRSDTNCDGKADVSDAVNTLNVLFLGTGDICCDDAADTNDDSKIDITDSILTLGFLFLGGVPPRAPFPACGPDDTEDALQCVASHACGA
jgi:hypothetical protein